MEMEWQSFFLVLGVLLGIITPAALLVGQYLLLAGKIGGKGWLYWYSYMKDDHGNRVECLYETRLPARILWAPFSIYFLWPIIRKNEGRYDDYTDERGKGEEFRVWMEKELEARRIEKRGERLTALQAALETKIKTLPKKK